MQGESLGRGGHRSGYGNYLLCLVKCFAFERHGMAETRL